MRAETEKEFIEIINRDYNKLISSEQAEQLGTSLLRLTRIAVAALARVEEKNSSIQAREDNSLQVPGRTRAGL